MATAAVGVRDGLGDTGMATAAVGVRDGLGIPGVYIRVLKNIPKTPTFWFPGSQFSKNKM
jgi:hypothetical protein